MNFSDAYSFADQRNGACSFFTLGILEIYLINMNKINVTLYDFITSPGSRIWPFGYWRGGGGGGGGGGGLLEQTGGAAHGRIQDFTTGGV